MKRRQYSKEFKAEAVKLLIMEGRSARELSEELGVNANVLQRWKRENLDKLEGEKEPESQSPKEMYAEIVELRKQLAKSQRMNEILKKTVGYFSKDD